MQDKEKMETMNAEIQNAEQEDEQVIVVPVEGTEEASTNQDENDTSDDAAENESESQDESDDEKESDESEEPEKVEETQKPRMCRKEKGILAIIAAILIALLISLIVSLYNASLLNSDDARGSTDFRTENTDTQGTNSMTDKSKPSDHDGNDHSKPVDTENRGGDSTTVPAKDDSSDDRQNGGDSSDVPDTKDPNIARTDPSQNPPFDPNEDTKDDSTAKPNKPKENETYTEFIGETSVQIAKVSDDTGIVSVMIDGKSLSIPVQTTVFNGRITKTGVAQAKLFGYNIGATVLLYYPKTEGFHYGEANGYMSRTDEGLTVLVDINGEDSKLLIKLNGLKSLF